MAAPKKKKIQLFLLSGFLGAGKTTLLKGALGQLNGKKLGCIQNEFGEIGVDGALLKRDGLSLLEISNGSIFCSCRRGQFIDALIELSERPLDFVFVECSGMSDSSSIENDLAAAAKKTGGVYDLAGTICVVDALNFLELLNVLEVVKRQVKFSNFIIINKSDLVDGAALSKIKEAIWEINPDAQLFLTTYCKIPFEKINSIAPPKTPEPEESTNNPCSRPDKLLLTSEKTIDKDRLMAFLKNTAPGTFRIKGFCRSAEGWHHIDCVGGRISVSKSNLKRERSELVLIMKGAERTLSKIRRDWKNILEK